MDIVRVVLVDEGEDEHVLAAVVGGEREQRLDGVTAHYPHSPTLFGQSPTSIQPCAEDQSFLSFSLLRRQFSSDFSSTTVSGTATIIHFCTIYTILYKLIPYTQAKLQEVATTTPTAAYDPTRLSSA